MKLFLLLLFIASPSWAGDWSEEDTYREAAFQVLNVIDWGQTRYVAEHPDEFYEKESQQWIGRHPSTGRVDAYMAESAILHLAVSYLLPPNWREAFQYISIGSKLNGTMSNARIGVKMSF